jgi:DNA-binding NtrC family response regulator
MDNERDKDCPPYRPHVLVADEDTDFLQRLDVAIESCGLFDMDVATSGREIVQRVNETCYDALVLEIKFPDILGTTIASLIHETDPELPIAILSKYDGKAATFGVVRSESLFWYKSFTYNTEELQELCEKIYNLSLINPCSREQRHRKREEAKTKNLEASVQIPDVLIEAIKGK